MQYTTTLETLESCRPGLFDWEMLRNSLPSDYPEDAPLSYLHILESNGVEDAIWALQASPKLLVRFALAYAEAVLPIFETASPGDTRPAQALEAVRAWLENTTSDTYAAAALASSDAYAAAAASSNADITSAAAAAAYVVAHATSAAVYAATDRVDYAACATTAATQVARAADGGLSIEAIFRSVVSWND